MHWEAVRSWRDHLLADLASAPCEPLSPAGARHALQAALDALSDEALATAAATEGTPWSSAAFVAARTVSTAPIEWCALLLGRGTPVLLKAPREAPGLAPWLAHHAEQVGLPLRWTTSREAVAGAELVLAMGSDETIAGIDQATAPGTCVLGFGHRFSLAWWGREAPTRETAEALADDLALHDTRGCMSPAVIFTDAPPDIVLPALSAAMEAAQQTLPRGACSDQEHADLRSRGALARVLGRAAEAKGWAVHLLPLAHARPVALPRCAQVVVVRDLYEALAWTRAWRTQLSTVGTTDANTAAEWREIGASMVCSTGQMQRPPLIRTHDGVDLVRATLRQVG
jgi:hypothetical protein